jgi:hypothetical protein
MAVCPKRMRLNHVCHNDVGPSWLCRVQRSYMRFTTFTQQQQLACVQQTPHKTSKWLLTLILLNFQYALYYRFSEIQTLDNDGQPD